LGRPDQASGKVAIDSGLFLAKVARGVVKLLPQLGIKSTIKVLGKLSVLDLSDTMWRRMVVERGMHLSVSVPCMSALHLVPDTNSVSDEESGIDSGSYSSSGYGEAASDFSEEYFPVVEVCVVDGQGNEVPEEDVMEQDEGPLGLAPTPAYDKCAETPRHSHAVVPFSGQTAPENICPEGPVSGLALTWG
jgi:hypothetical protein